MNDRGKVDADPLNQPHRRSASQDRLRQMLKLLAEEASAEDVDALLMSGWAYRDETSTRLTPSGRYEIRWWCFKAGPTLLFFNHVVPTFSVYVREQEGFTYLLDRGLLCVENGVVRKTSMFVCAYNELNIELTARAEKFKPMSTALDVVQGLTDLLSIHIIISPELPYTGLVSMPEVK